MAQKKVAAAKTVYAEPKTKKATKKATKKDSGALDSVLAKTEHGVSLDEVTEETEKPFVEPTTCPCGKAWKECQYGSYDKLPEFALALYNQQQ